MKNTWLDYLVVLVSPSYWFLMNSFSKDWDEEFNGLMGLEKFTQIGDYTANLGRKLVWIANHPYASFTPYHKDIRPSRVTILRAMRKLKQDTL